MSFLVTDAETRWLIITNAVLGIVVAIALLVGVGAVVYHFASLRGRRAKAIREADGDMEAMFGTADGHAFHTPQLGVTMADGGERTDRKAR